MTLSAWLDRLERLASEATRGPWEAHEWYGAEDGGWCAVGPHHHGEDDEEGNPPDGDAHDKAKRDSAYLAAIPPETVRALVAVAAAAAEFAGGKTPAVDSYCKLSAALAQLARVAEGAGE